VSDHVSPAIARLKSQEESGSGLAIVHSIVDEPAESALALPGIFSETALTLPTGLSYESWEQAGSTLDRINRAWNWWFGDWQNYGEFEYGEMYSQGMDISGLDYSTVANIKSVAKRITPDMRRPGLSWSHHAEVAKLEKEHAIALLQQAEEERWTREYLRQVVKHGGNVEALPPARSESSKPAANDECHCCCHGEVCRECNAPVGPLAD